MAATQQQQARPRLTPARARRESRRAKGERTEEILRRLKQEYPDSACALSHQSPFQLLVATILSAQCTDKRVNMVTPVLFQRFPGPSEMAAAEIGELEELVRTTGFFRNKARSLQALGNVLRERYGGEMPRSMPELTQLPGVGRKTANVVLGNAFGIDEGIVVDTHVGRLSQRLGLSEATTPERIERDLTTLVPKSDWTLWAHLLIDHGRAICKARRPACAECILADQCPSAEIV